MNEPRKLFVKSFGCQMNVYDSRRMADTLAPQGYVETAAADDADLVILNTCHIREKAAEKVYSELGRVRRLKEAAAAAGRRLVIAVAGCVAQAEGEEIIRRAPAVDLVFGPQSYHRLPELLARAERGDKAVDTEFPVDDKFDQLAAPSVAAIRARGVSAFVTVQEGCDKFCTFCVVPYTRGAEISRPAIKILAEVERLASGGVREITLIGQNVNAYHGDGPDGWPWSLARLLERAGEIEGIERLRYTTSHPRDMDDDLIAAHRDLPKLMPQLHLPVQSGSDRILAAMNRRHTRADYIDIVARLRAARPDLALTSDFIVGFPGESEADFAANARPRRPRSAFPAPSRSNTRRVPARRGPRWTIRWTKTRNRIGCTGCKPPSTASRTPSIGVASAAPSTCFLKSRAAIAGQLVGRSPYLQPVQVTAPASMIGEIAAVTITEVASNSLFGALAHAPAREPALLGAGA